MPEPILVAGDTCWRIETAQRYRPIVDAADYFRAVKCAMLAARHSIYLIGWDFDTRIRFETGKPTLEGPNKLGSFISWLAKTRPEVDIYILNWNIGTVKMFGRGSTPMRIIDWVLKRKRIHFQFDGAHPTGASHHQKIAVVDDAIAFCGGIDITAGRWDTREHIPKDRRRRGPWGHQHGPWHDATVAVDGKAARAFGDVCRDRWVAATGERPKPPSPDSSPWPEWLEPALTDVAVGVCRTSPAYDGRPQIAEIEHLFLTAIAKAEKTLYIESQYFACRKLAEAMAARLRNPDGPEIVVINPETSDGWLESEAMDTARKALLDLVHKADTKGRFRIFTPVDAAGEPIYVHAKVMVVDDHLLRIGSSNLNNRSMGFDSECDSAIEAVPGQGDAAREAQEREFIGWMRDDLLAEHLDVSVEQFREARKASGGSLIGAIESLARPEGRSLRPLVAEEPSAFGWAVSESDFLDPERPSRPRRRLRRLIPFMN